MPSKYKKPPIVLIVLIITLLISVFASYKLSKSVERKIDALIDSSYNWIVEFVQQKGIKHHDFNDVIMRHQLIGIDVSHHQQKIDWQNIDTLLFAGKEISFCFIKATEGGDWIDEDFNYNWKSISETDIIKGAYHYYKPNIDSEKQSLNFINTVNLSKGDLPPVIDVEEFEKNPQKLKKNVISILENFEKHYNVKPIIYTNLFGYNTYFNDTLFSDYPFWISYYSKNSPDIENKNWLIWQNSDEFTIKGIKNYVDLNLFMQSEDKFEQLIIK